MRMARWCSCSSPHSVWQMHGWRCSTLPSRLSSYAISLIRRKTTEMSVRCMHPQHFSATWSVTSQRIAYHRVLQRAALKKETIIRVATRAAPTRRPSQRRFMTRIELPQQHYTPQNYFIRGSGSKADIVYSCALPVAFFDIVGGSQHQHHRTPAVGLDAGWV